MAAGPDFIGVSVQKSETARVMARQPPEMHQHAARLG